MKTLVTIYMSNGNFVLVEIEGEPTFENAIDFLDDVQAEGTEVLNIEDMYGKRHLLVLNHVVSVTVEPVDSTKKAEHGVRILEVV